MNARTCAALLLLAATAPAGGLPARSERVREAIDAVQPAVVKVFGVKGFRGIYGYMTGVIVHESGLVITRRSVTLEEAGRIRCHLHDGRRLGAEIVREDRRSKMVLLRLQGGPDERFPVAPLAEAGTVAPGQFVLLIGNAYRVAEGREHCAVNLGVVSAVTQVSMRARLVDVDYDGRVILHDAMNNPGAFGGPLVDLEGRVVGISGNLVESRDTNAQVHFALPIEDLRPFIDDTVRRPGAPRLYEPEPAAPGADTDPGPGRHGLRVLRGGINRATPAWIDHVEPGSPAAAAGLRPDDLVLKIDESAVRSWKSFERLMDTYRAGQTVRLTVQRGQEIKVFVLTLVPETEK